MRCSSFCPVPSPMSALGSLPSPHGVSTWLREEREFSSSSSDAGSSLVTLNSLEDCSAFMNPVKSYMLPAVFPGYNNILQFSKGVFRPMDQFDAKSVLSFLKSWNERFGQ